MMALRIEKTTTRLRKPCSLLKDSANSNKSHPYNGSCNGNQLTGINVRQSQVPSERRIHQIAV